MSITVEQKNAENAINFSPFFDIKKEENKTLWDVKSKEFVANVVDYYVKYVFKSQKFDCGYELILSIQSCIKSFQKEKGLFLNYLAHSFKVAKTASDTNEKRASTYLISIPSRDKRIISGIFKYLENKYHFSSDGVNTYKRLLNDNELITEIAKVFSIEEQKVRDLIGIYATTMVSTSSVWQNEKSDETSTDMEERYLYQKSQEKNTEPLDEYGVDPSTLFINKESYWDILNRIEQLFLKEIKVQDKIMVSSLLTIKLLPSIDGSAYKELSRYTFINQKILLYYIQKRTLPTNEIIAQYFGKHPSSTSRTINNFLKKIFSEDKKDE